MAKDAFAVGPLGEDAEELDRVDADRARRRSLRRETSAGRPVEIERERLAVRARPLGDDVGDDAAVVVRVEVERRPVAVARSMRCIQTSRVKPMSKR